MNNCIIKVTFSPTSFFRFLLPDKLTRLALQPAITPELVQGRVHLKCTYSRPSSKLPLQYVVVWSRLSTPGTKEQIQHDTTLQPFSYVEMNGVNLRLGDTVMPPHLQQKKSNAHGDQILFFNHRITEWFGLDGTLKITQFQPPPPWAGTPSARPGCSKPRPPPFQGVAATASLGNLCQGLTTLRVKNL